MVYSKSDSDVVLIDLFKKGDMAAFSSLVRIYRGSALNWARGIVRDSHLAEDVVQEAFFQLTNKIECLQDPSRFRAWFRQIVRRLAINQIRGAHNRVILNDEEPMSQQDNRESINSKTDSFHSILEREHEEELLAQTLASLSTKAGSLMQAYAIEDCTPEELAIRFNTTTSNVYNMISRSRVKANDERFKQEMSRYLSDRRRQSLPRARRLPTPKFSRPYSLLAVAIYEVFQYVENHEWTLTDIMGISGEAFRLNVTGGCHWRGISTFDWSYAAYRTLERLGWQGTCFGRPGRPEFSPEQQIQVLRMVHDSIDRGLPAIIWNLSINEFGLIYGYDDDEQTIIYQSFRKDSEQYSYVQLGRNSEEPAIFSAVLGKLVAAPAAVNSVIASIIKHARGQEPSIPGFSYGLDGYRLWMDSVRNGRLDLLGHAYQVAILSESRYHAVQFLNSLSEKSRSQEISTELRAAAGCFQRVVETMKSLYPAFPFGYGESNAGHSDRIMEGLTIALEAETEGVVHLENTLRGIGR